jgi:hypothetical protein
VSGGQPGPSVYLVKREPAESGVPHDHRQENPDEIVVETRVCVVHAEKKKSERVGCVWGGYLSMVWSANLMPMGKMTQITIKTKRLQIARFERFALMSIATGMSTRGAKMNICMSAERYQVWVMHCTTRDYPESTSWRLTKSS